MALEQTTNCTVRSLVVVPNTQANSRHGGAQRTRLILDGLQAAGEAQMIVLNCPPTGGTDGLELRYPGIPKLIHRAAEKPDKQEQAVGLLQKRIARVRRGMAHLGHLFQPWRDVYRVEESMQRFVQDVLAGLDVDVIVVRRLYMLSRTGLDTMQLDASLVIDLDDREDLKRASKVSARLGDTLARLLQGPYLRSGYLNAVNQRLARADRVWLVRSADRDGLRNPATCLIPNAPRIAGSRDLPDPGGTEEVLLFVGTVQYPPNGTGVAWFLDWCWPAIHKARPNSRLHLVGIGDWSALKSRFSHLEGVVFVGEVDDLVAEYAQARAAIAPVFFGGGSQIKVIEACANGRPVITTPFCRGGYEGPIRDMLDATDDPTEFAELCVRYLSDPAAARDKGRQLQAQQDADYSWHGVVERIRQDVLSLPARSAPERVDLPEDSERAQPTDRLRIS